MGRTANATSKTTVAVVSPLDYIRKQQVASIEKIDCGICAAAIEESIRQGGSEIENGKLDIVFGVPNNALAIDGEKLCNLALFARRRSCRLTIKIKALLAKISLL